MNKFIQKIKNVWAIEDLRKRILNTLLFLLIYVLGTHIVLPGIDTSVLADYYKGGGDSNPLSLIDQFTGGAFSKASIFSLGVMPYITASIVIQLLGMAVPQFQKLQKEGESGRKKLQTYTKLLTIVVTTFQVQGYIGLYVNPSNAIVNSAGSHTTNPDLFWWITTTLIVVASTMFIMWLGEKITEKGIGNGVSLLITVGIIGRLPEGLLAEFKYRVIDSAGGGRLLFLLLEMVGWFLVVLFTILIVKGIRKVPLEYPKQMIAGGAINKEQGGGRRYLPLKIAMAGVMPIIFAQAIMFLPQTLSQVSMFGDTTKSIFNKIANPDDPLYNITTALLIIVFTYFYTAMIVNPRQWAEDFKKQGAFIPGVKPGNDTAEYIDGIMSKITFPGSIFLALIAILPMFARMAGITSDFSYFFGGTSLLIMVSVVLDTLQQVDSHLMMSHYDGLMKTGKVRGSASLSENSSVGMI